MRLGSVVMGISLVFTVAVSAQNRPFPQAEKFPDCIRPTGMISQGSMNSSVTDFYDYWKARHIKPSTYTPGAYLVFGATTDPLKPAISSSEAIGYGMIITALMAGYDPMARTYFDGLSVFRDAHKSNQPDGYTSYDNRFMSWRIDSTEQGAVGAATDGDMDMAYGYLLADYQWGSGGINYRQKALTIIAALKEKIFNTSGYWPKMGDWQTQNNNGSRPSDWMAGHMRVFADETADSFWDEAADAVYTRIAYFQSVVPGASTTGLISDFTTGGANATRPSGQVLESPIVDKEYSFNACRVPLRIACDAAHFGTPAARAYCSKVVGWINGKSGGIMDSILTGYNIDGSIGTDAPNDYTSGAFTGPFVAAAITDATYQTFLNSGWKKIRDLHELTEPDNALDTYYADSIDLLAILLISGNWWRPAAATSAVRAHAGSLSADGLKLTAQGKNLTVAFQLDIPGAVNITLRDMAGREISRKAITCGAGANESTLAISQDFAAGVYAVSVDAAGSVQTGRITVAQ